MKKRTLLLAGAALALTLLAAVPMVWGGPNGQTDPTQQQQTIDALVNERFTQTAQVQQVLDQTATAQAATVLAPTLTAQFEATVNAAFEQAMTATALAPLDGAATLAQAAAQLQAAGSFSFEIEPAEPVQIALGAELLPGTGALLRLANGKFAAPDRLELALLFDVNGQSQEIGLALVGADQYLWDVSTAQWTPVQALPVQTADAFRAAALAAFSALGSPERAAVDLADGPHYRMTGAILPDTAAALALGLAEMGDQAVLTVVMVGARTGRLAEITLTPPEDGAVAWGIYLGNYGADFDLAVRLPGAATPAPTPQPGEPTPRPAIFPTDVKAQVQIVEQVFERGRMFWVQHNRQIWVMEASADDPNRGDWLCYTDTFVDGEPEIDPTLEPPEGMIQPRRGFGKLWRSQQAIQAALGWAITPEFDVVSDYTYIAGGSVENGQYVPGPGEHQLTTLYGEPISFYEGGIRGECAGGTWYKPPA